MSHSSESNSWYRVAHLKPRLRSHVHLRAHDYRGRRWYVLQDPATGESHRLSPSAYALVGRMDGETRFEDVHAATVTALADDAPTQDEAIRVLGSLHRGDL
jgi:putative peptide zinc metalloprotease protein